MTLPWLPILLAAIASWLAGGAYYMAIGPRWLAAVGDPAALTGKRQPPPVGAMITSFVAELVMAAMFAGLLFHMGASARGGLISGALLWLGFVVTTLATNNAYGRRSVVLTAIDAAHWLIVLLIQGAIIGSMA